ncbi:hypothetical protein [Bacillus sp. ISTL8]|uniref:hypothetical protein n=1 Tax=Bacillus sp. ISTL8 TaxID=2596896 RepID=UPI0014578B10|nr:hypothetical protein [Bacillus sp. ISTL8]
MYINEDKDNFRNSKRKFDTADYVEFRGTYDVIAGIKALVALALIIGIPFLLFAFTESIKGMLILGGIYTVLHLICKAMKRSFFGY